MTKTPLKLALMTAIGIAIAPVACADTNSDNSSASLVERLNEACDDLTTSEGYNACTSLYQETAAQLRGDVLSLLPEDGRMGVMRQMEDRLIARKCETPLTSLSFEQDHAAYQAALAIEACNGVLESTYNRAVKLKNVEASEDMTFVDDIQIVKQLPSCFAAFTTEDRQAEADALANGETYEIECNIEVPEALAQ